MYFSGNFIVGELPLYCVRFLFFLFHFLHNLVFSLQFLRKSIVLWDFLAIYITLILCNLYLLIINVKWRKNKLKTWNLKRRAMKIRPSNISSKNHSQLPRKGNGKVTASEFQRTLTYGLTRHAVRPVPAEPAQTDGGFSPWADSRCVAPVHTCSRTGSPLASTQQRCGRKLKHKSTMINCFPSVVASETTITKTTTTTRTICLALHTVHFEEKRSLSDLNKYGFDQQKVDMICFRLWDMVFSWRFER